MPPRRSALLLALLGLGTLAGSPAAAAPADGRQDPESAATCGTCHRMIHQEWRGGAHARAFTDPVYQRALQGRERPELCHGCHIPQGVLERLGQKPRPRPAGHDDGVTCVACHRQGDAIHGPFGAATAAHPTVKDPVFSDQGSIGLCSSCHATAIADVLPVARDFAEAGLQQRGQSCVGCHMPPVLRPLAVDPDTGAPSGPARHGRSHALLGPSDVDFCRTAFAFRASRPDGQLRVTVRNRAGHRVPGLARLRAFPMRFQVVDAKGVVLHERPVTFDSDNPLLVAESRIIDLPCPAGAAAVQVVVDHRFGIRTEAVTVRLLTEKLEIP